MKTKLLILLLTVFISCSKNENRNNILPSAGITNEAAPCENGMAGPFPCNGYDFLAQISLSTFNAKLGNYIWGWTDATSGKEYALMGINNGTAFIDI